jgi:hypothetical protein
MPQRAWALRHYADEYGPFSHGACGFEVLGDRCTPVRLP